MNDFTKDEMEIIFNFIERHKQDSYDDMRFSTIIKKLKSMIDNYCDHEWYDTLAKRKYLRCSKCRKPSVKV